MHSGLAFDTLKAGIFPSAKFTQLTGAITREAFLKSSAYLMSDQENENRMWLMYSPEYSRAISECFPDQNDQDNFNWLVQNRESAGRSTGLVMSIIGIGKLLGIAAKVSKTAGTVINYGSIATVVGYSGYVILERFMKKKYVINQCGEVADLSCLQRALFELPEDHPDQELVNSLRTSDLPEDFLKAIFSTP